MGSEVEVLKRNRYFLEGVPDVNHSSRNHVEDWEAYHLPLLRMHHAHLHDWGIASGLEVSVTAGGGEVEVQPGVAVDGRGELIALSGSGQADVSLVEPGEADRQIGAPFRLSITGMAGQVRYLTIQYAQRLRLTEGVGGQLEQTPWLRLQAVEGENAYVDDGSAIILAVVEVDAAGVATVQDTVAALAHSRRLIGISGTAVRLRRTTASGGSIGQAPAAEITAGPGGGLRITVPAAEDNIAFAREDGGVFQQLDIGARVVNLQGELEVGGAATFESTVGMGTAMVEDTLIVRGAATIDGALSVRSDAMFDGTVGMGTATIEDTLSVRGATTLGGTTQVQGALEVNGSINATDIQKNGVSLVSSPWVAGATSISFTDGNVGIGTAAPNRALTIHGPAGTFLNVRANGGTREVLLGADSNGGIISTMTDHDLQLRAGGNRTRMIIKADGNVGIGFAAPAVKLHIVGGTDAEAAGQGGFLVLGNLSAANLALDDNEILARNNGAKSTLFFQANGGDVWVHSKASGTDFMIKDSGFVGIGRDNPRTWIDLKDGARCNGREWLNASSIAYKTNVGPLALEEALQTLAGLNPVTFVYKAAIEKGRRVGFIAEEVPDLVAEPDRQSLSTMDFVGILTKVVQYHQQQIQDLLAVIRHVQPADNVEPDR